MNKNNKLPQKEVLTVLNDEFGIPIKYGTLLNYEKWGLITSPRRGAGYGGKWAEYEVEAVAETVAAWKLIHGKYSDPSISEVFSGKPPSINPAGVALARAMFLKKRKKKDAFNSESLRRLDREDWGSAESREAMFLNDRTGYWYVIHSIAYIWRHEFFESLRGLSFK